MYAHTRRDVVFEVAGHARKRCDELCPSHVKATVVVGHIEGVGQGGRRVDCAEQEFVLP